MLKKRCLGIIVGISLMALILCQSVLAGPQGFVLHNVTGVDIYAIYIGSSDDDEWGDDLLDSDEVLMDGDDLSIHFDSAEDREYWDIRVEDSEGNSLNFFEIDLLGARTVILNADNTAVIK